MKRMVYNLKKVWDKTPIDITSNSSTYTITTNDDEVKTISVKEVKLDGENTKILYDIGWTNKGPIVYDNVQFIKLNDIKAANQVYIKYAPVNVKRRTEGEIEISLPITNKEGKASTLNMIINTSDFVCIVRAKEDKTHEPAIYGYIKDIIEDPDTGETKLAVQHVTGENGIYDYEEFTLIPQHIKGIFRYGVNITNFIRRSKEEREQSKEKNK